MPGTRKAEITKQTRLFDDFFKVDEVYVLHERQDGTMSAEQRWLIFERGNSVAVLLYNSETHTVVLVNQFKAPSLVARRRDNPSTTNGWVTEVIAGMIDAGETAEEAVIRETMEETGYKIQNPKLIWKILSSPGGASERIFLFLLRSAKPTRSVKAAASMMRTSESCICTRTSYLINWRKDRSKIRSSPSLLTGCRSI